MTTILSQSDRQLTLLSFNGEDTSAFLQGQLTNDVNQLDNTWQFSGYCSPKGRLLALLRLWRCGDQFYALVHNSIVEKTVQRLRMYVMRSKVKIEVHENISLSFQYSSQNPRFTTSSNDNTHTLSFGSREMTIKLDSEPSSNSYPEKWAALNIAEGLPEISEKTIEMFVPQMLNLDLLDGINFKKGCYTGQEIVARMHYLGKLKQRMHVCTISKTCTIGAKVMHEDKNVGHIAYSSENSCLAVLRSEYVTNENKAFIVVEDNQKVELNVLTPQPYSLELKS